MIQEYTRHIKCSTVNTSLVQDGIRWVPGKPALPTVFASPCSRSVAESDVVDRPIQPGPWSFPRERLLTQGSTKCKEADNFDYTPSMFSSTICVESTLPGFWRPTLLDALDHLYLARKVSESLLLSKTEFDLILLTWFFMGWDHIFSMAQDYHPKASWFQISKDNFVSPYP